MKSLTLILILLSPAYCFGQSKASKGKVRNLTISEIKKSFPYNKTESIKLVSFKYSYPEAKESDKTPVEASIYEPKMPKTGGQVDMTKMFEVETLDDKQEDELLNILMNHDTPDIVDVTFCYAPRNGIIFFDKDEHIVGYIEICFECLRYEVEPSTITILTLYEDDFEAIKNLFKKAGILYGTSEHED